MRKWYEESPEPIRKKKEKRSTEERFRRERNQGQKKPRQPEKGLQGWNSCGKRDKSRVTQIGGVKKTLISDRLSGGQCRNELPVHEKPPGTVDVIVLKQHEKKPLLS